MHAGALNLISFWRTLIHGLMLPVTISNLVMSTLVFSFLIASVQPVLGASKLLTGKPVKVSDLAYGEILYQYFQDNDFSALTTLLRAQKQEQLEQHKAEARVLQGRLYLRYGLQNKAERLLQELISQPIAKRTKSELYFLLAESRYQVGNVNAAQRFLARIDEAYNQRFFNEYHHLSASLAMTKGDFERANNHLNAIKNDANLAAFARYNHGIALLGLNEHETAIKRFNEVLQLPAITSVEKNLVDKTALTLGFYHLQNQAPQPARQYLLSVRESSHFATRALLGLGWSYLDESEFRKAITPWRKLVQGDKRDLAVQEGLLALPYAYQSLEANQQALSAYQQASQSYEEELTKLRKTIVQVNKGELLPLFRQHSNFDATEFQNNWQQRNLDLSTSDQNYYLIELLASKNFYFTFRDYQNLIYLKNNVAHWSNQIPIYSRMIKENRQLYRQKIPRVKRQLGEINRAQLVSRLDKLKQLRDSSDTLDGQHLLASESEKTLLKTIRNLKQSINRFKGKADLAEQEKKLTFLEGVLHWQLDEKKIDRQWQTTKLIWASQEQLEILEKRMTSASRSSDMASERFNGFDRRLNLLRERLNKANNAIEKLVKSTENQLNRLAVKTLEKRIETVKNLQLQADLATARLLDKSYSAGTSSP